MTDKPITTAELQKLLYAEVQRAGTRVELAREYGMHQSQVSEMINGTVTFSPRMARNLGYEPVPVMWQKIKR